MNNGLHQRILYNRPSSIEDSDTAQLRGVCYSARMDDNCLTVTEAAGRLHMHPSTLRRWIQRGWISAWKLPNGRYLVPEAEIEKVKPEAR